MTLSAFTGARIFDGGSWHEDAALLVSGQRVEAIGPAGPMWDTVSLDGGMLVPGFVDLQVNGGGGTLLNDEPTPEGIRSICAAHAAFGSTALLPTLITDTPQTTARAIEAGARAGREGVPGFLGLHLEGPHLAVSRKGAHDAALIRPMTASDLETLLAARTMLPNLLITVAPESVSSEQIAALAAAGIVVSIGHTDATYEAAVSAAGAGASMVTHLFNAQSQLGNRNSGVVGAALDLGSLHAGLIADGIHVHPASLRAALRAKAGLGRIFLVTDAMSVAGTGLSEFQLNGRTAYRRDGALRLADGTLAGADLTMIGAVRQMHREIGVPLAEALRMAALYPAEALGVGPFHGHLRPGAKASFVHLSNEFEVLATWIEGTCVFRG